MPNRGYNSEMAKTVFLLEELEASQDAERLVKALRTVEGVWQVVLEIAEKQVTVDHDEELASVEALRLRLDHIGFSATVA